MSALFPLSVNTKSWSMNCFGGCWMKTGQLRKRVIGFFLLVVFPDSKVASQTTRTAV